MPGPATVTPPYGVTSKVTGAYEENPGPSGPAFVLVDAGGLKPNTWQRFERLGTAWEDAKLTLGDEPLGAAEDEPGVVVNPRIRA